MPRRRRVFRCTFTARFDLVVYADSHEKANDTARAEVARSVKMMTAALGPGSPDDCREFDFTLDGAVRVTEMHESPVN